jgi:hypothetical protein
MIHEQSIGDLSELGHGKILSVTEIVSAHLARTEALNPAINAVCTLNSQAMAEAGEADRRLAAGLFGAGALGRRNIEVRFISDANQDIRTVWLLSDQHYTATLQSTPAIAVAQSSTGTTTAGRESSR